MHVERAGAGHLPQGVDGSLQGMRVAVGLVGPHDGRGMGLVECIAKTGFGATASDGRALEDEGDGFSAFGVCASGQLLALGLHLGVDADQRRVDELADRARRHTEHLVQLAYIRGESEGGVQPPPPCDVLPDPVGVQRGGVHASADQIARQGQRLGPQVGRHRTTRIANVGRGPVQKVGPVGAGHGRSQHRVFADLGAGAQRRAVDLVEPLRWRIECDVCSLADQLGDPRRRRFPRHVPSLSEAVHYALRNVKSRQCAIGKR